MLANCLIGCLKLKYDCFLLPFSLHQIPFKANNQQIGNARQKKSVMLEYVLGENLKLEIQIH